jgi:hypothetical protein
MRKQSLSCRHQAGIVIVAAPIVAAMTSTGIRNLASNHSKTGTFHGQA